MLYNMSIFLKIGLCFCRDFCMRVGKMLLGEDTVAEGCCQMQQWLPLGGSHCHAYSFSISSVDKPVACLMASSESPMAFKFLAI